MYDNEFETMENKILTKDKFEQQHTHQPAVRETETDPENGVVYLRAYLVPTPPEFVTRKRFVQFLRNRRPNGEKCDNGTRGN